MISLPLRSPVLHVWSRDKAIDRSDPVKAAAAMQRFQDTDQLGELAGVIRPGMEPAIFEVAPMSRRVQVYCAGLQNATQAVVEAVAFSLRSVRGITGPDGRPFSLEHVDAPPLGRRVTEECIDRLFDLALFLELGNRAMEISRLDP